jgi:hypothetical protein
MAAAADHASACSTSVAASATPLQVAVHRTARPRARGSRRQGMIETARERAVARPRTTSSSDRGRRHRRPPPRLRRGAGALSLIYVADVRVPGRSRALARVRRRGREQWLTIPMEALTGRCRAARETDRPGTASTRRTRRQAGGRRFCRRSIRARGSRFAPTAAGVLGRDQRWTARSRRCLGPTAERGRVAINVTERLKAFEPATCCAFRPRRSSPGDAFATRDRSRVEVRGEGAFGDGAACRGRRSRRGIRMVRPGG